MSKGTENPVSMDICDRQSAVDVTEEEIRSVLRAGLQQEGKGAELSIALVGDVEMADLNRRFLGCDAATDVLAFPYEGDGDSINGEIVVNADAAVRQADGRPHSAADELMLYVVHGLLHLLGYDDHDPGQARRMREREQSILSAAGRTAAF